MPLSTSEFFIFCKTPLKADEQNTKPRYDTTSSFRLKCCCCNLHHIRNRKILETSPPCRVTLQLGRARAPYPSISRIKPAHGANGAPA